MAEKSNIQVPRALLQAWVWMITESNDQQIIVYATNCLEKELGSNEEAKKYIEKYKVFHRHAVNDEAIPISIS